MKTEPSKKEGDLLVIMITGCAEHYIAEVIQENPLRLKVEEDGPYANLKNGDYIIMDNQSITLQDSDWSSELLRQAADRGQSLVSGLKKLGVEDGRLHKILSAQ